MSFTVKATYRNETRKLVFPTSNIPLFKDLNHQLSRIFNITRPYYLSNVYFSQDKSCKLFIGLQIRTVEEYDLCCSPFQGGMLNKGCLTFTLVEGSSNSSFDQLKSEVNNPVTGSLPGSQIPQPNAPDAHHTSCCSVAEGRKEIKGMIDGFLHNLHLVLSSTFGDEPLNFEPFDTPRRDMPQSPPSPLPPLSLDTSLHIPGTFMRSRPDTPFMAEDEMNVEKNQSPPHLEPYQTLHPGIWCDFCGKQIKGLRFQCQECPHYDLCANCIVVNRALDKHNEDKSTIHRFHTLSAPPEESLLPLPIVPAVSQSAPADPVETAVNIHSTVFCDRCDIRITSRRYKCLNCPDFDLCEGCIGHVNEHDDTHRFLFISTLSKVKFYTTPAIVSSPTAASQVAHNARCDLCDGRIVGQRMKCLDCPDFDTCFSCFAITPEVHPNHSFVKIHDQQDYVFRSARKSNHSAECDACNKLIFGVRYKCMHPDCPDFDLCQNCEALPFSQHPDTHPMLKLKTNNTYIPPRPKIEQAVQVSPISQTQLNLVPIKMEEVPPTLIEPKAEINIKEPILSETPITTTPLHQTSSLETGGVFNELVSSHTANDPNEADPEERARYLVEKEIQELEEARRRKHDNDARQASNGLDSGNAPEEATASPLEWPFNAVLEQLERLGYKGTPFDGLEEKIRNGTAEYSSWQQSSRESVTNEVLQHQGPTADLMSNIVPNIMHGVSAMFQNSIRSETPKHSAIFISENVPDGHVFPLGTEFIKSWRIRNDGPAWEKAELVFVGGNRMNASSGLPNCYPVNALEAGGEMDVVVRDMKAPEEPGRYISHWRLRDVNLNYFGPAIWCDIISAEVDSDASRHSSLSNSAVIMPEIAPTTEHSNGAPPVTATSTTATAPISLPADDSSDGSSAPSLSAMDQSDGEWDDLRDVSVASSHRGGNREDYQVVYDSDDDM